MVTRFSRTQHSMSIHSFYCVYKFYSPISPVLKQFTFTFLGSSLLNIIYSHLLQVVHLTFLIHAKLHIIPCTHVQLPTCTNHGYSVLSYTTINVHSFFLLRVQILQSDFTCFSNNLHSHDWPQSYKISFTFTSYIQIHTFSRTQQSMSTHSFYYVYKFYSPISPVFQTIYIHMTDLNLTKYHSLSPLMFKYTYFYVTKNPLVQLTGHTYCHLLKLAF